MTDEPKGLNGKRTPRTKHSTRIMVTLTPAAQELTKALLDQYETYQGFRPSWSMLCALGIRALHDESRRGYFRHKPKD